MTIPDTGNLALLLVVWLLHDVRSRLNRIEKFLWPYKDAPEWLKKDRRSPYKVTTRWERKDVERDHSRN